MYILSVIIPVFNVDAYLRQCLDSICNQDVKNIQIICVDDCSTDNSRKILSEYAKKYSYIEVYENITNLGLSETRNKGLSHAAGEYIMFLDSDDYIAEGAFDKIFTAIQENKVDILPFSVQMFLDNGFQSSIKLDRRIRKYVYEIMPGIELMCNFIKNREMFGAVWGAIYRKDYLLTNHLRFIEGILHEDIPFMFSAMLSAKSCLCLNEIIYFYRQRETSILHKPDYKSLLTGLMIGYMDMINTWHNFNRRTICSEFSNLYIKQYLDSHITLIEERYSKLTFEDINELDKSVLHFLNHLCLFKSENLNQYFTESDLKKIQDKGKVSIYGAGKIAGKIVTLLKKYHINIDHIYVTSKENNPKLICGIMVEEYVDKVTRDTEDSEYIVVAVSVNFQREIVDRIKKNTSITIIQTIAI